MKRNLAATIALGFFLVFLASQASSLTAQTSPLIATSPLATIPLLATVSPNAAILQLYEKSPAYHEMNYNPRPPRITPQPVPFVDAYGATIVKQEVIEYPDRNPVIVNIKATPQPAPTQEQFAPLTFESPLNMEYKTYMPLVSYSGNTTVLVIAYVYTNPWIVITDVTRSVITDIYSGTRFHGTGKPSINFGLLNNQIEITTTHPPSATYSDGTHHWNLQQIYNNFNVCNRVISDSIDEVWIWIGGDTENPNYVYGNEWETNGPILSTNYGVFTPPNCGKQMFTMGYNYRVGEGNTLESWIHSTEFTFDLPEFSGLQSCDFGHPGGYGWYGGRGGAAYEQCRNVGYSDVSGFTVQSDPGPYGGPDLPGVCGTAHFPPNVWRIEAVEGSWRYHSYWWDNPRVMPSRCTDWQWNIITNTVPISCGAWGCNQPGFFVWWMQNVPGIDNNLHGRDGSLRPNWWNYRLTP